jgi:SAM-dependent methyltransferase
MDLLEHNRRAWNKLSAEGNEWTLPVDSAAIARARAGDWQVVLTPVKPVPADWFGDLRGQHVLCLASGGGQQAPLLAAAGASVVTFDLSDAQIEADRRVAEREGLAWRGEQGDMADLSRFGDAVFDLIFHPVSNVFVPDVQVVWRECHRVLRPGGVLLAGFMNPSLFLFDQDEGESSGVWTVKHRLPYSDLAGRSAQAQQAWETSGEPATFSHSLQTQIGGQLAAGFVLTALYEDHWAAGEPSFSDWSPVAVATRAVKPEARS